MVQEKNKKDDHEDMRGASVKTMVAMEPKSHNFVGGEQWRKWMVAGNGEG